MERFLIEMTADGSATLYLSQLDEHYHSVKGALEEALHVYVDTALHYSIENPVQVLEFGFGTGLNAYLSLLDAERNRRKIFYTTLELYPLSPDLVRQMKYPDLIDPDTEVLFDRLHLCDWNEFVEISPYFSLRKLQLDFQDFVPNLRYDVVYYDAFAPEKQPELWQEDIFNRLHSSMNERGVLSTYCAKGEVRRSLQRSGFVVERLAGPVNGKREILRAVKINDK